MSRFWIDDEAAGLVARAVGYAAGREYAEKGILPFDEPEPDDDGSADHAETLEQAGYYDQDDEQ